MEDKPSHKSELNRLNRIIGQLQGVKKMITEEAYCPDILTQTKAISSAIRSLETNILEKHIHHCVKNSMKSSHTNGHQKIEELVDIFKKRLR